MRQRFIRPAAWPATCLLGLFAAACGGDSSEAPAAETAETAETAGTEAAKAPAAPISDPAQPLKVVSAPSSSYSSELPEGITVPADDAILGKALVINGKVVPHDLVRRQVVLGERGKVAYEMKKLEVLTNQEVERRVAAGASAEEFVVTDAEVQKAITETEAELKEEFPDEEVGLEQISPTGTEGLNDRVALTKLFFRVFLPDVEPDEYPAITLAALNSSEQGSVLLNALKSEWEDKQAGLQTESHPMFQQMVFQALQGYLFETSTIEEGEDLPADVLMRLNGEDIRVGDVWTVIEGSVSVADVRAAKQWIVNMELLRLDLAEDWLSAEEAAVKYAEHSDPYKGSMFSMESIATMVKKYPSVNAYKEFRRAYDSFQQRIADELTAEELKKFADERTKFLIGQTLVDVDIILVSAYDFKFNRWKENGWDMATKRAQEVVERLVKGEVLWDDAVAEYSDFYDPPIPASHVGEVLPSKSKGRFRNQNRNGLMQLIDESEYWMFLNGKTLVDFIYFEQEVGSIANPIRGPYGWYIPRLLRKSPSPTMINLDEAQIIDMAEQDYTLLHLSERAQELIGENQVYGLE